MFKMLSRKATVLVALVLIMTTVLSVPAQAAQGRMSSIVPELSFDENIADCRVSIVGEMMTDRIYAVITLSCGAREIATWTIDGYGYIFFSETEEVTRGKTYTLTVAVTLNGVSYTPVSVSAKCV